MLMQPKCFVASDTCNGKMRPGSTESDLSNGISEMVLKKRCLENDSSQKGSFGNREDEPSDGAIPSKSTMEDEIQQIRRKMDNFTHEVQPKFSRLQGSYFLFSLAVCTVQ